MPVLDPHCPAHLRDALNTMEGVVQRFKRDLPYKAPEVYDHAFGVLQMDLADVICGLYDDVVDDDPSSNLDDSSS